MSSSIVANGLTVEFPIFENSHRSLKKKVLRFLDQKHIRALYHRIEKDDKNFGRIFVHFRH